ncbi:Uncharacterized protein OBRU01_15168 [Operophtera brumata]|uniref:Protein amnionless n=1 Tax=Operophtera brumata TaxID=104452 RepID=A0A0L7L551_OPEBR|nr:Uncharacterized protein OBRU01_15168 [Operophtera brumata]
MDALIYKLIVLSLVSFTSTSVVKWLPNASFNLPINFKDGKVPCSKKNVIFPQSISGSVGLQDIMEVGALILPEDGEIVLENAIISLGKDVVDTNCTEGNSYYLDKTTSAWTQAGVWYSSRFTEATPDTERLPCYDDYVEFSKDTKYTVTLPDQQQYIRGLKIGNESFTTATFLELVEDQSDQMQQFVFNLFYRTGLSIVSPNCQMKFGCPCQPNTPKIDCTVKFCPKPSCVAPIKPEGFCCSFCGGHIMFEVDEGFDMISFKELVVKTVDGFGDSVVYHIGVVSTNPDYKVQLVIVDTEEYDGNSAEAVNIINNDMLGHWYKGEKLSQISGSPLSKKGLGVKIFISMFFVVLIVMSGLYLYYYKLPNVQIPAFGGRSTGMFTRFQYRSDSVVSLTRRDSSISAALPSRTAFRNPLYDSKRGRVEVEQSVDEE